MRFSSTHPIFASPRTAGKKAYQLLTKALEDAGTVGVGLLLMHQRDYTVFLRPYQHGLLLHSMYFANEIRQLPAYGVFESTNLKPREVKLTEQLIESLTEPFKPKQYHNEFQEKLKKLIEAKQHSKSVEVGEPQPKGAPVIDMMTELNKSLAASSLRSDEKQSRKSKTRKMAAAARRAS